MTTQKHPEYCLNSAGLKAIFDHLKHDGYQSIGPVARDGAIMLEPLEEFEQLARGYTDKVAPGTYKISRKSDEHLFQYANGPQSFKKFLYPPRRKLWSATVDSGQWNLNSNEDAPKKMAFWGIRGCDLEAIRILDRVFLNGPFVNPWYQQARNDLFTIAVACTAPTSNCFCTTMGTGPLPESGYDLLLTEVYGHHHFFRLKAGSERGMDLVALFAFKEATTEESEEANKAIDKAAKQMPPRFDPKKAEILLKMNLESSHWEDVANRCLGCANCTLVCPTCFCSTTEDVTDLTGTHTERWNRWDSCFTADFSYIHGGSIRPTTRSRYRQWLTHKLSSWWDQFGTVGCVGCGRCITWCPVGIDLTEELLHLEPKRKLHKNPVPHENH